MQHNRHRAPYVPKDLSKKLKHQNDHPIFPVQHAIIIKINSSFNANMSQQECT